MATIPNGPYRTGTNPAALAQTGATIDPNPLDYSSPQFAIAAGLDPTAVMLAWAKGLAQYSTQDAAVAAGIMPGVVTQLWGASRQYVQTAPSGTPTIVIVMIAAGLLAFLLTQNAEKIEL